MDVRNVDSFIPFVVLLSVSLKVMGNTLQI